MKSWKSMKAIQSLIMTLTIISKNRVWIGMTWLEKRLQMIGREELVMMSVVMGTRGSSAERVIRRLSKGRKEKREMFGPSSGCNII